MGERQKTKSKEQTFLIDNFFFKYVRPSIFSKRYFDEFIYKEYNMNEFLFNEDDKVDYVYFIKEGDVELTMNTSILQITKMIHDLKPRLNFETEVKEYKMDKNPCYNQSDLKLKKEFRVIIKKHIIIY